jgi:hypothetical protein
MLSAVCGLPPSLVRTKKVPTIEVTMPTAGEDQRQEHGAEAATCPFPPDGLEDPNGAETMAPMIEPT